MTLDLAGQGLVEAREGVMATSIGQGIQSGSDYAWQLFLDALSQAVASTADLQARLGTLVLGVYQLRQDNFPETQTWERFQQLLRAASGSAPKLNAAKVLAATAKMTDEEAAQWLGQAVRIFSDLSFDEDGT